MEIDNNYRINDLPPTVYCIPEFITEDEEARLLYQVDSAPKPKWTQLSNRRLQNWGGLPHPKGMVPEPMPEWLEMYCKKTATLGVFEGNVPNHVLVNEYLPGQGIMPHEDGPLYFPTVANLTMGSHSVLDLYRPLNQKSAEGSDRTVEEDEKELPDTSFEKRLIGSMLLQRRSLFLMCDDMYKSYLHGIEQRTSDTINKNIVNLDNCSGVSLGDSVERSRRVSLTIRYVPKVMKAKFLFGKRS